MPAKEVPASPPKIKKSLPHHTIESNPFTTTQLAIAKLLNLNLHTSIGVVLFTVLLFFVAVLTAIAIMAAAAAFIIQHAANAADIAPLQVRDMAASITEVNIYITWIIGVPLLIGLIWLGKTLLLSLVTASAKGQEISFDTALRQSFNRLLPLLWLDALVLVALFTTAAAIVLLGNVLGPIMLPIMLVAVIVIVYGALRLVFTTYALVDERLGPVAALKRSWHLTRGHIAEVAGIISATGLMVIIPAVAMIVLAQALSGTLLPTAIVGTLSVLAVAALAALVMCGIAERFAQLRDVGDGKRASGKVHISNYVALLLFVVLAGLAADAIKARYSFDPSTFEQQLRDGALRLQQESPPDNSQDQLTAPGTQATPKFY